MREILARTLLTRVRGKDPIFAQTYTVNLYRGCEHGCIYCDSRSQCYGIEDFSDVQVKVNAIELLEKALASRRRKVGVIGFGAMSDPYTPTEMKTGLTRRALEVLARHGFPANLITKSDRILRDIDVLQAVNRVRATVCFTITTPDDDLARRLEPGAPPPSARFAAMRALAEAGLPVGTTLMPVLPFLEDDPQQLQQIVSLTAANGGSFIVPWLGVTLRDRQRDHFYQQLDRLFPGMRARYERAFGEQYFCPARGAQHLYTRLEAQMKELGLGMCVPPFNPPQEEQLSLF